MDEGTNRAIPLRRSRGASKAPAPVSPGFRMRLTAGVLTLVEPPRQVWLATLGTTALTLRGARDAWSALVAEGAAAESWLRRTLARSA